MKPYEPREDTLLLKKHIAAYVKDRSVLDMGTGSGALAEEAARHAEYVVGVDVDTDAVQYAREHVLLDNVEFMESDLFNKVEGRFDVIIFNPPYLPRDKADIEDLQIYGGTYGYETILRFLDEARDYLKKGGHILLLFSSFSHPEKIKEYMLEQGYFFQELDKEHVGFEDLFVYDVWRE